jgi:serine/threonine protein kinase
MAESSLWLNKYQIRKEIGSGHFGKVFLARDVSKSKNDIHKRVAIKALKVKEEDEEMENEHLIFEMLREK